MTEEYLADKNVYGPGTELLELINKNIIDFKRYELIILDVGFNDPASFILLHYLHGLKIYKGIDFKAKQDFNINISFKDRIPEEMVTSNKIEPFERYELFYKYVLTQWNEVNKLMLNQVEFESIFQFVFETKIQDYIKSSEFELFSPNIIFVSNLLHLISDKREAENIFVQLLNELAEDGIIWIKIYNSRSESNSYRFPYSESEIKGLEKHMETIYKDEQDDKTLIIGKKKKTGVKDIQPNASP